ncbi:cytochrome bc complex cytochrome b subunit [Streptacidiphilus sp. EB129]|uniref:cytochrome bc1 complex cytochrome b subunit n=1 Tax=Streptacidiphilus sp. EB129 TaxID=3156262 RepID=UPI0035118386
MADQESDGPGPGPAARQVTAAVVAVDQRLPLLDAAKGAVRKVFPDHWSFLLGELALYSLVVLLLTGVYLTLFFNPSMSEGVYNGSYLPLRGVTMTDAYSSTLHISFDVRGGLLVRQIHHWAALLFVSAIGVHMLRIFFTGAFRRPRELNWIIGMTLFVLGMVEGFCGYSLPDDLLSGTGLRIAEGVMLSIPLVGSYVAFFAFGGEYPGHEIIPRLYVMHILLVPGLILALVGAHLTLVVVLKHTQWGGPGKTNRNVVGMPAFPQFTARTTGLLFMLCGVLALASALGQINPIWDFGPYRPDQASQGAQPDWYIGWLEGALRLMPGVETRVLGHTVSWSALVPALVVPGLLFGGLFVYPFLERWVTAARGEHHLCDRPRNQPTRTGLGAAGIAFYAVLLLAGANDLLALTFDVSLQGLTRVLQVALFVAPLICFLVAKRVCLGLQAHDRELLLEGFETGEVHQTIDGGYGESRRRLTAAQRYRLLARDLPEPPPPPALLPPDSGRAAAATYRLRALRASAGGWFHRDRVLFRGAVEPPARLPTELPATPPAGPAGPRGPEEDQ